MRVLIQSWAARQGGRARALLALADRLASEYEVTVSTGALSHSPEALRQHHGFFPDCDWRTVDWRGDGRGELFHQNIAACDPDAVISFDTVLNGHLHAVEDRVTVGYCRTKPAFYADELWAPSRTVAEKFNTLLTKRGNDVRVRPIYPIWYIDEVSGDGVRDIDVVVHGRKARDALSNLAGSHNILVASHFSYPRLTDLYRQSDCFLFPEPDRFEPLGLMPIEAAAHGCRLALPTNTGASEIYPDHVYDDPVGAVPDIVNSANESPDVPTSPTDPVERLRLLAEDY